MSTDKIREALEFYEERARLLGQTEKRGAHYGEALLTEIVGDAGKRARAALDSLGESEPKLNEHGVTLETVTVLREVMETQIDASYALDLTPLYQYLLDAFGFLARASQEAGEEKVTCPKCSRSWSTDTEQAEHIKAKGHCIPCEVGVEAATLLRPKPETGDVEALAEKLLEHAQINEANGFGHITLDLDEIRTLCEDILARLRTASWGGEREPDETYREKWLAAEKEVERQKDLRAHDALKIAGLESRSEPVGTLEVRALGKHVRVRFNDGCSFGANVDIGTPDGTYTLHRKEKGDE